MAQYIITNEPEEINFEIGDDIITRTIQNCKNLLMTRMGEVPFDRFRGLDPAIFNTTVQSFTTALLPELDRLMEYEIDAEVVEATATLNERGEAKIRMVVKIDIEEEG